MVLTRQLVLGLILLTLNRPKDKQGVVVLAVGTGWRLP